MRDVIYLPREYERKIDIIKDFWLIQKECRESIYYLKSLIARLDGFSMITKDNRSSEEFNKRIKIRKELILDSKKICNEHEEQEKLLVSNEKVDIAKEIASDDESYEIKDCEDKFILDITVNTIKIKAKIDDLQVKIIDFLNYEMNAIIEEFIKKIPEAEELHLAHNINKLNYMAFNHNVDEDRIDTYLLDCSDRKYKNILKKTNINLPYTINVKNYEYTLKKVRELYSRESEFSIHLITKANFFKENTQIKKMNKKLYYANIIVTILTVITTIIAIYGLFMSEKTIQITYPPHQQIQDEIIYYMR